MEAERRALGPAALGDREFRRVCQIIRERAGIVLGEQKRHMVQTRLARRLRALAMPSYRAYVARVETDEGEVRELVNALTTNVTSFFREPHHFDALGTKILPAVAARQRRIRLWSAGCSTGEEPWSLAMVVRETLGTAANLDIKILATDIDSDVLAQAAAGVYRDAQADQVGRPRRLRFFGKRGRGEWQVNQELRSLVTFKQLNLFDPAWPMRGPFDVIMCRNVIIYFEDEAKRELIARFRDLLAPRAYLILGHSESLRANEGFEPIAHTIYRRP